MRTFRWGSVPNGRIVTSFAAGLIAGLLALLAPAAAQQQSPLSLTKAANPTTFTAAGQSITYTYTVTNNDDTFDIEDISITDNKFLAPFDCIALLGPGASATCTATYTTTAADVAAGSVTNTAVANGTFCPDGCIFPVVSLPASATITFLAQPSLSLAKTPNPTTYDSAGDVINYSYVVTNNGNVALSSISVADDKVASVTCLVPVLAPGGSTTCSGSYTTTTADVTAGSVTNTATASGTCGGTCGAISPQAQATVFLDAQPSLALAKTANPTTYDSSGDVIAYTYIVTNTGNVPLSSISVTDNRVTPVTCLASSLDPDESTSCTGTYTTTAADVTAGSVTNTATASGECGEECSATSPPAQATITFVAPPSGSITIVKLAEGGDASFEFTATNSATPGFTLETVDGQASRTFDDLEPGTYGFTEVNLPPLWELAELTCDDEGGTPTTVDLASRSVSIGLDGGEAITCIFGNAFNHPSPDDLIENFLRNRLDRLAEGPDRARIFRRLSGAVWGDEVGGNAIGAANSLLAFSGNTTDRSTEITAATSLLQISQAYAALAEHGTQLPMPSFDVWVEVHYSHFDDDGGTLESEGEFGVIYLGADYLLNPAVLVGALVQFDWDAQDTATSPQSDLEGHGWMAGPYFSARITPGLFFDARAAWGTSDNTIEPFGLAKDDFSTDRWLASAKLTGNWSNGNFRVTPSLGVVYAQEHQNSYTDSFGVPIPSQTVSLGRVSFGPEFAYRIAGPGGGHIEPQFSVTGLWDFDDSGTQTVGNLVSADDDFRAMLQAGFLAHGPRGASMRLVGTYDGIGSDFESYGGQVWVSIPFH
jgi:hypothetical protein